MLLLSFIGRTIFSVESAFAISVHSAFEEFCGIISSGDCDADANLLKAAAFNVGNFFAGLVSSVAVLVIIYASIRMIMSGGTDQGKEEAKKILIVAITGLILALAAESVILFVGNFIYHITP
ncbi:MAG: hypothetical protein V1926_03720 [Candidatus Peregrinibacteria bacterium]